jgi:hypothetical protein
MVLSGVVVFLTTHLTSLQFLLMNDLNFANLWVLGLSSSSCLAHHQKQQQSKDSFSNQRVQRVPSEIKEHSSSDNQRVFLQQAKKTPPPPPLPPNRIAEAVHQWVWLLRMRSFRTCNVQFCLQEYRIINQSSKQS